MTARAACLLLALALAAGCGPQENYKPVVVLVPDTTLVSDCAVVVTCDTETVTVRYPARRALHTSADKGIEVISPAPRVLYRVVRR